MNIYEQVKDRLSIIEVVERYGVDVKRGGMVKCPFHDDKNPSMKLYEDSQKYHCFGCGEHGDVIDFVSKLFNLEPYRAAQQLVGDFGIVIDGKSPQKWSAPAKASIKAKIERYTYELQERRTFNLLSDYCHFLRNCKNDYRPQSPADEQHPLFVKSIVDLGKFEHYTDWFIYAAKEEKQAFMRDCAGLLSGIEKEMRGTKACQVELA